MFTKTSRTDRVREQVADVGSTMSENVSGAWRGKVAPTVSGKARDAAHWAAPHVERGREAAAPKVEAAVDKVSPAVDAAREKLEELMPRLAEAVSAAAAAGSAASAHAGEYRARHSSVWSTHSPKSWLPQTPIAFASASSRQVSFR